MRLRKKSALIFKPNSLHEVKAYARRVKYLRCPNKIRVALVNEFGLDTPMPTRSFIEQLVDAR